MYIKKYILILKKVTKLGIHFFFFLIKCVKKKKEQAHMTQAVFISIMC